MGEKERKERRPQGVEKDVGGENVYLRIEPYQSIRTYGILTKR